MTAAYVKVLKSKKEGTTYSFVCLAALGVLGVDVKSFLAAAYGLLVVECKTCPKIEPRPSVPTFGAWSLDYRTTREVPGIASSVKKHG